MTKAHHRMEQVQTYLKSILHEHQEILSKTKLTYFQKTLKNGTDYQSSIAFLRFIKLFYPRISCQWDQQSLSLFSQIG